MSENKPPPPSDPTPEDIKAVLPAFVPAPVHPIGFPPRRTLQQILQGGPAADLRRQWDATPPAREFVPLPTGIYDAHVHKVELHAAKTGTPGVKIQFRVCAGDHVGRMLFHDCWLTPAALAVNQMRDCEKLRTEDHR